MIVYMTNILLVYICAYFAGRSPVNKRLHGMAYRRWSFPVTILAVSLILIEGLRYGVGTDYWTYHSVFSSYSFDNIFSLSSSGFGFDIIYKVFLNINSDPQFVFLMMALITNVLAIVTIKNISDDFALAMFLFITSGVYYASFNGIRQMFAVMVIFFASKYLFAGRWKPYVIFVLLASTIHQTAIIMLPAYFILRARKFDWKMLIVVTGFILFTVTFTWSTNLLINSLGDSKLANDYRSVSQTTGEGINILRFLLWAVPVAFAFVYRNKLKQMSLFNECILNASILGTLFMLIATKHWIFARMAMYFSPFYILLVSQLAKTFRIEDRRIVNIFIMAVFFVYGYFYLLYDSDLLPYRWQMVKFHI
ncbi:MAG: EpsG family protein [Armatimonadota bacterium]